MSDVDLNKLKVVELKAELQARGLDTKGNKPVLIDRLKEALEKEKQQQSGGAAENETAPDEPSPDPADEEEELDEDAEEAMLAEEPAVTEPEPEPEPELTPVPEREATPPPAPAPVQCSSPPEAKEELPVKEESPAKEEPLPTPEAVKLSPQKELAADPVIKEEPVPEETAELETEKSEPEKPVEAEVKKEAVELMETNQSEEKQEEVNNEEKRGKKRQHSPENVKESKLPQEDEPEFDQNRCLLSWYDSDLNLVINKTDFLKAEPMTKGGFAFCWAGARASFGLQSGKAFFEVMIDKYLDVSHLENETDPNVLRVGWSAQSASMQLGEEEFTYGYGGTGKISTNSKFSDYGKTFQEGSVVGAFLDMSGENVTMSYTVDGEDQGVAFTVPKAELSGQALFPHILTKNCSFSCNFGSDEPWFPPADSSFDQIGQLPVGEKVVLGPQRPASKADCEVLMMVGVPGSGKTFWANKHASENTEKHYNVLGTNNLIDKMKVMGLPRRRNYNGRWEELISSCTDCFNKLLQVAVTRRRNYILDQTNVYASARQRKMQPFKGFVRVAVAMVPTAEELTRRIEKREREEGKDVPDSAVFEMKANFVLPVKGEVFDEVRFVEAPEDEALKIVDDYIKEANAAGYRKKEDAKVPRYENKQPYGGHRSNSGGNTNSRYHTGGGGQNRFGGGGGGGGGGVRDFRNQDFRNQDYRNPRFGAGGGAARGGTFVRRDNRDGFRGASAGGGYRGSGGGAWRGNSRDNRDNRGYERPDYNRRGGGGDFRRPQKDYNKDRGYSRPTGDRDRRNDRYGGGNQWSSGGSGSSYNSGNYSQAGGYGGGYGQQQQRSYNQNQYGGYSSYSSYPNQQQQQQPQQSSYQQTTGQQSWTGYGSQPQQQQSTYGGGWQQYGGYGAGAAQSQQGYTQGAYSAGTYQQNPSSGSYSTAQK